MHVAVRTVPVALALFIATASYAIEPTFDRTFDAKPGERFSLNTDVGSVKLTGADVAAVTVHVEASGPSEAMRDFTLTAERTTNGVVVEGHRTAERGWDWMRPFGDRLRIQYVIQVPRNFQVDIRTSGGKLDLANVEGPVDARTSGGNVRLSALNGELEIRTSGGDIDAERLQGKMQVRTSGGEIVIRGADGDLDARTSGGEIELQALSGKVQARTSGGNISAQLTDKTTATALRTSGGNIDIRVPANYAAAVSARTSGGRVRCDLPFKNDGDIGRYRLQGTLNGGGDNHVEAHTSGGNIHIRAH